MKTGIFAVLFLTFLFTNDIKSQQTDNQNKNTMFLENESKYGFDETVEILKAETEKKTWKVVAIHDLENTLANNGYDVLPVKVFSVCHPKHSSKILEKDDERIVSSLMPCRVSVYEKSDCKVYISRMNTGVLAKSFGGIIEEVMEESTKEIEEILSPLLK